LAHNVVVRQSETKSLLQQAQAMFTQRASPSPLAAGRRASCCGGARRRYKNGAITIEKLAKREKDWTTLAEVSAPTVGSISEADPGIQMENTRCGNPPSPSLLRRCQETVER
jgi:hypothetical protein